MNRRLPAEPHGPPVSLSFEGRRVEAAAGESVAVALFASGERVLSRSIKYHRPRGFFCLSGHCGACLMRIDGRPNVKACMTPVRDGMTAERQNAFPSGGFDVLGAADFLFPKGMDHHTMMTSPRALNAVMQKVVRQLAGLGRLPDLPPSGRPELPAPEVLHADVAVIGGGPAGLAAAAAAAGGGARVILVDEQDRVGGSLLADPRSGPAMAERAEAEARQAGVEIRCGATAVAWYPEDAPAAGAPPGVLAVQTPRGLLKLTAERYIHATGAYDQNALFGDNDRPGVLAARAVGRLLVRYGVLAGRRPVVVGGGPYARALADALANAGAEVVRVDGVEEEVVAAHGHSWVRALEVRGPAGGRRRRIACDLVAVAALPAPASELARQHGAQVRFDEERGGFPCCVDGHGCAVPPRVFACGDLTGFVGPEEAAAQGARVGREARA
jgi:sarcosine oxidase subunit alpha